MITPSEVVKNIHNTDGPPKILLTNRNVKKNNLVQKPEFESDRNKESKVKEIKQKTDVSSMYF